jgi:hypothetical protein
MEERRSHQRRRVLRSARIVFNDKRSSIDCIVRNLSETGARLQVESASGIPPFFDLLIMGEDRYRHCRLMWNAGGTLGITFGSRLTQRRRAAIP